MKKFLVALKHREITLQHYEIDARRSGDKETETKVQKLLAALRDNIATLESTKPKGVK